MGKAYRGISTPACKYDLNLTQAEAPYPHVYVQDVSMMLVVTFSGVTSGGIVTSGTTCWTC